MRLLTEEQGWSAAIMHYADIASTIRGVAVATTFWLPSGYNFGCVVAIATRCLILGVGFRGQAIKQRHIQDIGSKGCCYGNRFWDYISCKWPLTGDNDMEISYKGWLDFNFNQPPALSLSLES